MRTTLSYVNAVLEIVDCPATKSVQGGHPERSGMLGSLQSQLVSHIGSLAMLAPTARTALRLCSMYVVWRTIALLSPPDIFCKLDSDPDRTGRSRTELRIIPDCGCIQTAGIFCSIPVQLKLAFEIFSDSVNSSDTS